MLPERVKEMLSNICDSLNSFDSCGKLLEFFFDNFFELVLVLEGSNFNLKEIPESLIQAISSTLMREQSNIVLLFDDLLDHLSIAGCNEWEYQEGNASFICRLRSSVAFLFDHFYGLSKDLDCALDEIKSDVNFDLEIFDAIFQSWTGNACGYLQPDDIDPKDPRIPKSHYWWSLPFIHFPGQYYRTETQFIVPDYFCTKHLENKR